MQNLVIILLLLLTFSTGCDPSDDESNGNSGSAPQPECAVQISSQSTISSQTAELLHLSSQCASDFTQKSGTIQALADLGSRSNSGINYFLTDDNGQRYAVEFAQKAHRPLNGDRVQISAVNIPCAPQVEAGTETVLAITHQITAQAPIISQRKVAVFLINFQDLVNPFDSSDSQYVVFNEVNEYMKEASFQKLQITGQTFGPYTISESSQSCNYMAISQKSQAAARAAGVDLSQYSSFIYLFPTIDACAFAGLGTIGGAPGEIWINGYLDLHTVAHEIGHNLGLFHSNSLDCGRYVLGRSCRHVEYGDTADAMGNYIPGHFNGFQKENLGWDTPTLVNTSGRYTLSAYETDTANPKTLKILRSINPGTGQRNYYYVEYRQSLGFDTALYSSLTDGLLIHTGASGDSDSSYLLNMKPSRSFGAATLLAGQTLDDWSTGITIRPVSIGSTATVDVLIGPPRSPPAGCN